MMTAKDRTVVTGTQTGKWYFRGRVDNCEKLPWNLDNRNKNWGVLQF